MYKGGGKPTLLPDFKYDMTDGPNLQLQGFETNAFQSSIRYGVFYNYAL